MVPFIQTANGVNMVIDGKPVAVSNGDKHFNTIVEALKKGVTEAEIKDILEAEVRRINEAVKLTPKIEVQAGVLYYEGQPLHSTIASRILQMREEGFNLKPIVNFLENFMQNPSNRIVEGGDSVDLYAFLEMGKNAITEDGHFLAYKAVRGDYMDIHSGTFNNSIGEKPKMNRNRVDENPDRTCSAGLHVCSFDYLPHFAHANGHIMICKVNPRDVVSIPKDYNNTKMRVCEYEVVGEYLDYYTKDRVDVLASSSVQNGVSSAMPFEVRAIYGQGNAPTFVGRYATLLEAASDAEDELNSDEVYSVSIFNTITNTELDVTLNPDYDSSFDADDDDGDDDDGEDDGVSNGYVVNVFATLEDFNKDNPDEQIPVPTFKEAKLAAADIEDAYAITVVNMDTCRTELTITTD